MTLKSWVGYCPHFHEVMDLNDCFFCYFKKRETKQNEVYIS
jgi:hypothetical protein